MRIKVIPSQWLRRDSRRLDCGPYTSGALEAKVRLEELAAPKHALRELTRGHNGGIYNGPKFSRTWVDDPDHGVPFVGSGAMLHADLSSLPLLRRKDAEHPKLAYLRLAPQMTLITCSGTIGRMVYSRPDMDGIWSSQHIMKVVPDPAKVPPGYLFAYLSGKFGVPLVVSGTYGSIIQSIEPQHIADLPVPRLGSDLERETHDLVEAASKKRARASKALSSVTKRFDSLLDGLDLEAEGPRVSSVPASGIRGRFDAQFHDPTVLAVRARLRECRHTTIGEMCNTIHLPGIFKRIHIEDLAYGAPYYTGASLYWLEPIAKGILSRKTKLYDQVELQRDTILVQAFGQDGGITGRPVWVGENLHGSTTTHMLCRLRASDPIVTAYLYGFLASDAAYRQVKVLTYGGSIPHFDEKGIATVVVPWLGDKEEVRAIGEAVLQAHRERDEALNAERKARSLVERAIEEAE